MYARIMLIGAMAVVFFSCVGKHQKTETGNQDSLSGKQIDSILDSRNTDEVLVRNSPRHNRLRKETDLKYINAKASLYYPSLSTYREIDSVSLVCNDTAQYIEYFYASKGCEEIFPFHEAKGDTIYLKYYTLKDTDIQKQSSGEYDVRFVGLSCMSIMYLKIRLPQGFAKHKTMHFAGKNFDLTKCR